MLLWELSFPDLEGYRVKIPSAKALPQLWTLSRKMQRSSITYGTIYIFKKWKYFLLNFLGSFSFVMAIQGTSCLNEKGENNCVLDINFSHTFSFGISGLPFMQIFVCIKAKLYKHLPRFSKILLNFLLSNPDIVQNKKYSCSSILGFSNHSQVLLLVYIIIAL